jgi:hypothetical protein
MAQPAEPLGFIHENLATMRSRTDRNRRWPQTKAEFGNIVGDSGNIVPASMLMQSHPPS